MKIFLLSVFVFINSISYSQSFQMQYNKISDNEVQFITIYKGPSTEIILPPRGRIIALSDQNDLNAGGGRIRVGIRVGSDDADSTQEYTVRFTYSLLLPSGGFGSVSQQWYPTIEDTEVEYSVTSLTQPIGMVVYPYTSKDNNSFSFLSSQNPKLAIFNHTIETSQDTEIPITVYSANPLVTSFSDIIIIYNYVNEYFGKQEVQEIVIINTLLITRGSFIDSDKLYLNIAGTGTENQIKNSLITSWMSTKENLSSRLFNMFKDSVFRLAKLPTVTPTLETTPNPTPTEGEELETPTPPNTTSGTTIETDPSKIVLVPPTSYYQNLFTQGFMTNEIQYVDIEGIFNNYALLHLAQYGIGTETILAGIKAYFNQEDTQETKTTVDIVVEDTVAVDDDVLDTPTVDPIVREDISTDTTPKKDTEYVDWNMIMQNQVQEPLYSLYTKEVLVEKGLIPLLTAKRNIVTRNSFNIPNFTFKDFEDNPINVEWNDFRSISISVPQEGNYTLDPEKQVPQQSFIESYYTFNTNEQSVRIRLLAQADRQKAPGEISIRKHLEIVKFTVEDENSFGVETGSSVYVVISHILSNTTKALKPAIKESFFSVDSEGTITYLTTRMRV